MKKNSVLKRQTNNEIHQKKIKKRKENIEHDKISKSDLYKPPTVEELNQLRETEILFNSNLFRLQTEELVKEVSLKEKRKREINRWLQKFEKYLNNLPEYDDLNLSSFNACFEQEKHVKLKGTLKLIAKNKPLTLKTDQDAPLKLLKPHCVQVVGLYPLNATIGPTVYVTVNVVMPKSCFHEKDYLNARYMVKRSLYLSYIGTHLNETDLTNSVSYTYLNGNELHPILHISTSEVKKTVFVVLVSPEEDTFKPSRFANDKSNLRWSYWSAVQCVNVKFADEADEQPATPWYNAVLSYDTTLAARDTWARGALQGQAGARDALLLLSVWLRQRQLDIVGEALLLGFVAQLADTGRLNRHMSSYQAVRQIWTHLATCDTAAKVVLLHCDLAAHLHDTVFQRVQQEARVALQHLDAADLHAFQVLFITPMSACMQYDVLINIYNTPALEEHVYAHAVNNKRKLDYLTFKYPLIVNQLTETLCTGLTDRITCLVARPRNTVLWDIENGVPANNGAEDALYVSLGLCLNITNMYRVVDKGPPVYDPQASSFRSFWGDKAELRRFKDGSISEAVYWPASLIRDKRNICKSIIDYVLKEKYKLENYNIVYDQFEASKLPVSVEEANLRVVTEFDSLAQKLRELQLPLSISSVAGISAAFSHSDPFPPVPVNHQVATSTTYEWNSIAMLKDKLSLKAAPAFVKPVEAVIQMVHNSKWPGELGAMRALRGALLLQAAEQLRRSGLACNVGADGQLDVSYGGLVSRLELYHPRELSLLEPPEAVSRKLRCDLLPRLRGALAGVHARRPALGPTAALARRWLRAQLLDLPDAVAELLCAHAFLPLTDDGSGGVPALPQRAFLHFLALVSRHTWATEPLLLDWNTEMSSEEREELTASFRRDRDAYPALCVFTPWDRVSRVSAKGPSTPELQRLRLLATGVLEHVEQRQHERELFAVTALFKPNLTGYHLLIQLQSQLNARRHEALDANTHSNVFNYDPNLPNKMPIVHFNPAEIYLQQLRENYGDFALFFYDIHGGDVIAVLWKPNILEKVDFKISQVGGMKLLQNEQKLQVNVDAIIEDFYILGEGIVKNIQIK